LVEKSKVSICGLFILGKKTQSHKHSHNQPVIAGGKTKPLQKFQIERIWCLRSLHRFEKRREIFGAGKIGFWQGHDLSPFDRTP